MATYTVYLAFTGGKGSSVEFRYPTTTSTTGAGHSSSNPLEVNIGDNVKFVEVSGSGGGGTVSGLDIFTNNTDFTYSGSDGIGEIADRTVGSGSEVTDTITATAGVGGNTDNFYIKRLAAVNLTAPTGLTTGTDPGTYTKTITTAQTATGGTGGTMQVSENGTTWVTNGSSFTFTRGVGKPIYARTVGTGTHAGSISSTSTFTVTYGYKSADLAISVAPTTTTLSATNTDDITITVSNGTANNQYRVLRTTNGNSGRGNTGILTGTSGTVVLHSSDTGDIPAAGNTYNYVIQGRVPDSKGGNDTYATTNGSFSITRSAVQDTTPDNFVDFTPVTNAASNQIQTSNTQTITGITGNVNVSVSGDGSPQVAIDGGFFTATPGTIANGETIQVRLTSSTTASAENVADVTIGTVTKEFSVTTAASGGSGSGVGGSGSDYGVEIYDTNGTTTVLSPTTRYITLLNDASSVTIPAKSNGVNGSVFVTVDMTGLTTSNSDVAFTDIQGSYGVEVVRVTTGSPQGFRLENTLAETITVTPFIIRY